MVKGDECLEDGGSNPEPESVNVFNKREPSPYVIQECRTRAYDEAFGNCGIMCFTLLAIILCLISFIFCKQCLFLILIISACLCPFFHPMNAPLWLAIVLLVVGGWNFTMGALTVTWNYNNLT
jgi:hypothetical protein